MIEKTRIHIAEAEKDRDGKYTRLVFYFGPHFFASIRVEGDRLRFALGATHHGFEADATELNGELEQIINEVREAHPDKMID